MKTVSGDEGTLSFRLPAGWVEDREADGGLAYHAGSAGSGTLRVKLMTFTSEEVLGANVAFEELEGIEPAPGQKLEALPGGNALRVHSEESSADGEPTVLHVWLLAGVQPPHRMHMAVFSYTLAAAAAADPETARLVKALDREVRRARFAHQAGV